MTSPVSPSETGEDPTSRGVTTRLEPPSLLFLLLGCLFLAASAYLWIQWFQIRSRESILEVRTLTLRTPIDGVITNLNTSAGQLISRGEGLFTVQNSKVPRPRIGDLQLQLTAATARLELLKHRLARSGRLVREANSDLARQSRLQVGRHEQELQALYQRRQQAVDELTFLRRDASRKRFLFNLGSVAYDQVDRADTSAKQAKDEIHALDNQINAQRRVLEAAQKNLTLIATRGGADPESRFRDEKRTLDQIQDEYEAQQQQLQSLQEQLNVAKSDYQMLSEATVRSPIDGVVWHVDAFSGSGVQRNTSVLQVLDCKQRWINTYVREADLRRLRIGQRASISLYGSNTNLKGSIAMIRSGIGRLSSGSDAPPLLPINIYREAQVKVVVDPGTSLREEPQHLCYAGYTGRVTFSFDHQRGNAQ